MRKIMLIVWRWTEFERAGEIVTNELLTRPEYHSALTDIAVYKNQLFDEYTVCEQQPDGTAPAVVPSAMVVRTHIKRIVNQGTCLCCEYLEQLIAYYQQEPTDLLLFLHRKDGFTEENVSYFLPKIKTGRCFLIGGGRDNIYYREERNQGLLADDGYFYRKISGPGSPSIKVANKENKVVYFRYFDKVWTYYKHEFYTKIYELKEDLLRHFYALDLERSLASYRELSEHLEKNRGLALRVASFIDDDCSSLKKTEKEELDGYGKEAAKSYEFDDLKANLEAKKNITTEYVTTSDLLHKYFHTKEDLLTEVTVREVLTTLNKAFIVLLERTKELK